jgi:hypothetical protein
VRCWLPTYAVLFRRLGIGPKASLLWAAAGIFCTPNWYYGTSTFDDILGAAAVVLAVAIALGCRERHPGAGAVAAGLALGLAFNCKQPLGIFILPVLAALYDPAAGWRSHWKRLATVRALLAAGVAVYEGYTWYKFPPGSTVEHAGLQKDPIWSSDPVIALVALLISPAAGVFFYNPPLLLCVRGVRSWHRSQRFFCLSLGAAIAVFVLFICSLTFFKGDPAWGSRYLTPVFAVLWIMAPTGFLLMRRRVAVALLAVGLLVQVSALAIDPYRLYLKNGSLMPPELYFHPAMSHLINRPGEIAEVLSAGGNKSLYYERPYRTTFPLIIVLDSSGKVCSGGRDSYQIDSDRLIDSLRPWWASLRRVDARARPIDIPKSATLLLLLAVAGSMLMITGVRGGRPLASAG